MCTPQVLAAGWQLARLAAQAQDETVATLAGQLLAAAGPLDPQTLTLDIPGSGALGGGAGGGGAGAPVALNLVATSEWLLQRQGGPL
jgi:hypothetical protein